MTLNFKKYVIFPLSINIWIDQYSVHIWGMSLKPARPQDVLGVFLPPSWKARGEHPEDEVNNLFTNLQIVLFPLEIVQEKFIQDRFPEFGV